VLFRSINCCQHFGFKKIQLCFDDTDHPNGPAFALLATKPTVLTPSIERPQRATLPFAEVSSLKQQLEAAKAAIAEMQCELNSNCLRIKAMETSKFWQLRKLERELELTNAERDQYRGRVSAIGSSKFWQLRTSWMRLKNRLLGSQELLDWTPELPNLPPLEPPSDQLTYEQWRQYYAPRPADYARMRDTVGLFSYQPLISLLLTVANLANDHSAAAYLSAAINSVIAQIYPHWQLCLTDHPSTEPHIRALLQKYAEQDSRIKLVLQPEATRATCANSVLENATGEYVALLNPNDLLAPEALYEIALLLNKHPEADFIYSDSDKIDEQDNFSNPAFKPDWSPDSLLCHMYIGHLSVYRRTILNQVGGFRVEVDDGQAYDLALRFTEQTERIFHIPQVLYHERISSTAGVNLVTGEQALKDALERRGEPGQIISIPHYPGHYIIRYEISDYKLVSIIIPTRDLGDMLDQCLESIFGQSTYPNYEVIVIDNGSVEEKTQEIFKKWQTQEPERFRVYPLGIPFNYSKINNFAATKANGEFLLFLNNDTAVITPDWITAMVEQARRQSIGAVGAQLLYPDQTIQHAGIILGIAAATGHGHKHFPADAFGYLGQLVSICNYAAVTGACLMCRKDRFHQVGGFEEELEVSYNDIDLCLKFLEQGLRNIYLPHVKLYHYESKSRGEDLTAEKQARFFWETNWMKQRWPQLMQRDPYYNPNLTTKYQDYRLHCTRASVT